MQLITWTLALITLITLFSNLNRLTMGAKVEFVYNVLSFVRNCKPMLRQEKHTSFAQ